MEKTEILTERNVVVEVLKRYRQLPYLWNSTHKLYTNKLSRRQGMQILLEIWRKLEPNADIECMKKKLNNWRAAYRRERKKIQDSMRTASEPDEIHKPNLWYYDHLTFIHEDCPVLSGEDNGEASHNQKFEASHKFEPDAGTPEESDDDGEDGAHSIEDSDEEPLKKLRMSLNSERQPTDSSKQNLPSEPLCQVGQVPLPPNDENSADLFGRAIGSQLKDVSKFQRCLAEKLISEVMFYAKLEQLTIGTTIQLIPPGSMHP